ncbi:Zinc finger PHD-finger [Penicillium bovifimosum]|uniref:Zinc finger PHD-finger n=1 Tax=Penicillium bovifimosum TaxID=126998 RepID=A0A9W9KVU8_9EURO|nr:Zinc finger PHD-finger [Penicillium bovifimosum]KAJ5121508.1 Zinc finger PHD-finger [Penicillium bovifimosum]
MSPLQKTFEDETRPRRVRWPRTMAFIDCEITVPDNPNDGLFGDDWKEKRARGPAADVVLNFITAVKQDHAERHHLKEKEIEQKCLDLAKQMTAEFLSNQPSQAETSGAAHLASGLPEAFKGKVSNAARTLVAGGRELDAANALLSMAGGQASSVGEGHIADAAATIVSPSAPISVASSAPVSAPSEGASETEALPADAAATSVPSAPVSNTSSTPISVSSEEHSETEVPPRIPASSRKRSRSDDQASEEPAQKRQFTKK